jgi:hypothetical protein
MQEAIMDRHTDAPDPRQHYASPQALADDTSLAPAEREALLREWQYDLEQRLRAIAEGMDPDAPDHDRLSAELRRVAHVHEAMANRLKA